MPLLNKPVKKKRKGLLGLLGMRKRAKNKQKPFTGSIGAGAAVIRKRKERLKKLEKQIDM